MGRRPVGAAGRGRGGVLSSRGRSPAPFPDSPHPCPLWSPPGPSGPLSAPPRLHARGRSASRWPLWARGGAGRGQGQGRGLAAAPPPAHSAPSRTDWTRSLRSGRVRRGLPTCGQVRPWAARSVSAPGRSDLAFAAGRARRSAPTSTAGLARRPRVRAWGASRGGPSVCPRLSWGPGSRRGAEATAPAVPARVPHLQPDPWPLLGGLVLSLGPGDISGGSGAQLTPMRGNPPPPRRN